MHNIKSTAELYYINCRRGSTKDRNCLGHEPLSGARSVSSGKLSSAASKSRSGYQYATLVRTLVMAPQQSLRASSAREAARLEWNYSRAPKTPSKNRVILALELTLRSEVYLTFGIPMVAICR